MENGRVMPIQSWGVLVYFEKKYWHFYVPLGRLDIRIVIAKAGYQVYAYYYYYYITRE